MRCVHKTIMIAFLLLFTVHPVCAGHLVDKIVAVVNGEIITLFEVNQRAKHVINQIGKDKGALQEEQHKAIKREVLQSMVDNMLVEQEAERLGLEISEEEVENRIRQVKQANNLTEEEFVASLMSQGLTREEYENNLRRDILKHKVLSYMVKRKVVITEQEIEAYYNSHPDKYQQEKMVRLGLIVLPKDEDGESLREDIISGKITFEEAASKHSVGPGADNGGELGAFLYSELAQDWKTVLEELQPGEVSQPFDLGGQTALLHLKSVESSDVISLEKVRDEIYETLYQPKLEERFQEYIQTLRNRAVIDVRM